jgi:hypothetical protein
LANNAFAKQLFERSGFEIEGCHSGSVRINGQEFNEIPMALTLHPEGVS